MKFHGIQIQEGSSISNLTVASGTLFPGTPNEAEMFYRTDSDIRVRGLYAYIGGTWDRIASADSVTVPSAADFPLLANTGDLFYRDSNDANEALYVYTGAAWIAAASGSGSPVAVTGDVTGTLFVGGTGALTLATITTGTAVGIASASTIITYDSKGRITTSSTTPISIAANQTTSGTFADVRIAASNVTQHQSSLSLSATQVTSGIFADARIASSNVTQHQGALSLAANQTTSGTFADARIASSSVTQHQGALSLAATQLTSGTFADTRIAASNVTQHQAALTILETQITNGALLARLADNETITGSYQFNNPIVTATPISGSHATTKDYVDQAIAGLSWKNSVLVTTTANITLSGLQTIDGIAVVAGNRVLVKNQSTQSQNGVYVVAAGAWTRAADFDAVSPVDEVNSAAVFVRSGTTQADTAWTQTASIVTIGSDAMVFAQFAGSNLFIAGTGLTMTGNSFDVNTASAGRIVVNTDNIDLALVTNSGTGTFQKLTTDAYGRVSGTTPVVAADITPLVNATYVAKAGDTMTGLLTLSSGLTASSSITSIDDININGSNFKVNTITKSTALYAYDVQRSGSIVGGIKVDGSALFTTVNATTLIGSLTGAASLNVLKAGDTMTGNLVITNDGQALRTRQVSTAGNVGLRIEGADTLRRFEMLFLGTTGGGAYGAPAGAAVINSTVGIPLYIATGDTTRMIIDAAGNINTAGAVPKAWGSAFRSLTSYFEAGLFTSNAGQAGVSADCYNDGTDWRYADANQASRYEFGPNGAPHRWFIAPVGVTNAIVPFTEVMRITAAGNVSIGATGSSQRLSVNGNATFSGLLAVGSSGPYDSSVVNWISSNANQLILSGNNFYDNASLQTRASSTGFSGTIEYDKGTGAWSVFTSSTSQTTNTALTNFAMRMRITAAGVIQDGASLELGWKTIPQNSQSAAYTLILADSGRHIFHPAADTTARTFTIPANASVAFPIGTAVTFVNQNAAGVVTIAITTDTMRLAGAGTTGSRTLAANGIATAMKITATEWIISGTGLT